MKRASILKKAIDSLSKKNWKRHDLYYLKEKYIVNPKDVNDKVDIALLRGGRPIGMIGVKDDLNEMTFVIEQGKLYASALGVKFIFVTDGTDIFQVFNGSEILYKIQDFPSVDEIDEIINHISL
jgi:type I site-specific restriction endonuclease